MNNLNSMNEADDLQSFRGCLERNGKFLNLDGLMAVYLSSDWSASLERTEQSSVIIFFDSSRQLYVVEPLRAAAVFLPSGQPLGRNKQYHLRRGMKLCLASPRSEPAVLL